MKLGVGVMQVTTVVPLPEDPARAAAPGATPAGAVASEVAVELTEGVGALLGESEGVGLEVMQLGVGDGLVVGAPLLEVGWWRLGPVP